MKTILHLTNTLTIGGTEILLKNTIPLLPQYNHVICYLHGEPTMKIDFKGVPIYCLEHNGKSNLFRSVLRLRRILKANKIDILHSHLFWSGIIARLAKIKGVKLAYTLHNVLSFDAFQKNKYSLIAERATIKKVDALIGVSSFVLEDYMKHVRYKGATHLLYNFIPSIFFDESSETEKPNEPIELRCVAVGTLNYQKNYEYLLSAFSKLKGLPVSLDIFGDGPKRESIQKTIDEEKLHVRLKGISNSMERVLPGYDIFLQASHYEGYGIALVEGMAKGLLPLISNIPVHKEVAGESAFYFDLESSDSLAELLKELIEEPSIINRNRQGVMQRAKLVGSPISYKEKLEYIYNSMVKEDSVP